MSSRNVLTVAVAFALAGWVLATPEAGQAGVYPGNQCASAKMKEGGKYCMKVLKAWSVWDKTQDDGKRDEKLTKAKSKLDEGWDKAETKAADKGVDCVDMTVTADELALMVGTAAGEIVAEINSGLDLGDKDDGKCGSKFIKAAAKKCLGFLKAESKFIKKPDKDPDRTTLAANKLKASNKFDDAWAKAEALGCAAGTSAAIEQMVDEASDDVVLATTVSPNVPDDAYMAITHPAGGDPNNPVEYEKETLVPQCQDGSAYTLFAKRGTVNKLLMYYDGGGACWDTLTCGAALCTQNVGSTPPGLSGSGFADLTNPDNPFKDWHIVRMQYCSCDVHWGDNAVDYPPVPPLFPAGKHVEHRGYDNAKLGEKWAREHFVSPTDIFVTGSSAGSYGAMMHGIFLNEVWPAASINVMGDGGNGVITQEFLTQNFANWGVEEHLPDVPGIAGEPVEDLTIPIILTSAASYYPRTNWSNYTTAFDGGTGGQTGFYNVMLNPDNLGAWPLWWNASCDWNEIMRQQAIDTAAGAAANYRYYIASGSHHTGFGVSRVYDDTTGGVPPLVDWINAMIDDDPAWVNVEASPFNVLFPGDPKPSPLAPPFEQSGPDVVVNCP